ncbi:hypothetical protein Tco_0219676 [Tanacetum coccineum]
MAREKEILERQDEEALQQAMEKERDCQRQYEERERFKEQQRQWDFDHDYFNPKNFTIFEDEMDVDAINKTPTSNNLNVNTQESGAVHMEADVVEPAVADGLVQDQIIDKVVVVVVSYSTKKSKGKKAAKKPARALPFRIYHKNKGKLERIANMQAKKFKIDDNGSGPSADKALSLFESE